MKKAVLIAPRTIEIVEAVLSDPKSNEVQVQIKSCGICGSDIPRYFRGRTHFFPITLGHEFYGVVNKIGRDVNSFAPGDHVVGVPLMPCFSCPECKQGFYSHCRNYRFIGSSADGAFAEAINVPQTNLFKIDPSVASVYCALFEPSTIALHALFLCGDVHGKRVAVIGGGTIGMLVAKWAQIKGAEAVHLFVRRHDNDAQYRLIGLDDVHLSYGEEEEFFSYEENPGHAFDLVLDAAGNDKSFGIALRIAKRCATICLIGTPNCEMRFDSAQWDSILRAELIIKGSWMGYSSPFPGIEWKETLNALKEGALSFSKAYFSNMFSLDKISEAFEYIQQGKNGSVGRVLLVI